MTSRVLRRPVDEVGRPFSHRAAAMVIKHQPCAYCGTTDVPREKGHVIPRCMYPMTGDLRLQRPTVPECSRCKMIWQDAENQFRNVLVIAGEPNAAVWEQWEGPVRRSFNYPSGRRWLKDIFEQMVAIDTPDGPRHMVYPARDPRVMLVVRKIIRGLFHYHKLGTAVPDTHVWADVLKYQIQSDLKERLTWFNLGQDFVEYGFEATDAPELNIRSAWYFRFYGHREFVGFTTYSQLVP
jgi:hypothetical protein